MIRELLGACAFKIGVQLKKTVGRKEVSMATLQEAILKQFNSGVLNMYRPPG